MPHTQNSHSFLITVPGTTKRARYMIHLHPHASNLAALLAATANTPSTAASIPTPPSCHRCKRTAYKPNMSIGTFKCANCETVYCSSKCREKDQPRHEETKNECVKSIKEQLPQNTLAPSVPSILLPDLLAHAISFLSVYQWSLAARVNHAWRNVTLQPLAFPHEVLQFETISVVGIGPAHRACIRSMDCEWRLDDTPSDIQHCLSDYSHLQYFHWYLGPWESENGTGNGSEKFDRLPATLKSLHLMTPLDRLVVSSLAPLARFTQLRNLSLALCSATDQFHTLATVLQQMIQLASFKLLLDFNGQFNMIEYHTRDRKALLAILDTIALHLFALNELDFWSEIHWLSPLITRPMPQVTRLSLREPHFKEDTTDTHLHALSQLSKYLPGVTHLTLKFHYPQDLVCNNDDGYAATRNLTYETIIQCVTGFATSGPQLKALNLKISHLCEHEETESWQNEYSQYAFPQEGLTRLLTPCKQLEQFVFDNFEVISYTLEQIEMLSKLTPSLQSLEIVLQKLSEAEITSSRIAGMIESLTLWFPHLTSLTMYAPVSDLPFAAPSSNFLAREDSLPRLKNLTLFGFDSETHLPSLLRLLPRIDTVIMKSVVLTARRFFEYAQYHPLALPQVRGQGGYASEEVIQRVQTIEEEHLAWFDAESNLVQAESISKWEYLAPYYLEGVELSKKKQQAHDFTSSGMYQKDVDADDSDDDSDRDRGGRGRGRGGGFGGRGRGRGRGRRGFGTSSERQAKKSVSSISHGWMFTRVHHWQWDWCEIVAPSSSPTSEGDQEYSFVPSLPTSLVYHRSFVWTPTDISHTKRDQKSLRERFTRSVEERTHRV